MGPSVGQQHHQAADAPYGLVLPLAFALAGGGSLIASEDSRNSVGTWIRRQDES